MPEKFSTHKPLCPGSIPVEAVTNPLGKAATKQCVIDRQCEKQHFCNEWEFKLELVNQSKLTSNLTSRHLGMHHLYFYFVGEALILREIELMTFDTFISNLGGLLGLFTGVSLVSLSNAFLYCLQKLIKIK